MIVGDMTETREFKELDETKKSTIKLGDDNDMCVEGKDIDAITTTENKVRYLKGVQYIPKLAHNLLSVG